MSYIQSDGVIIIITAAAAHLDSVMEAERDEDYVLPMLHSYV
jgi:hypothetical protein